MARLSRGSWLTVSLVGVCILLALVVWTELSVEPRPERREMAAALPDPEPDPVRPEEITIGVLGLQDYEEIVRRPLFSDTRKPYEPAQPKGGQSASKVPPLAADNLIVLGIVISPDMTIAIFQDKRTKKIVKAAQGTNIGGWEIMEIREDGVTIRLNDRQTTLMLHRPDDKKKAAPKRRTGRRSKQGLADARARLAG